MFGTTDIYKNYYIYKFFFGINGVSNRVNARTFSTIFEKRTLTQTCLSAEISVLGGSNLL
jgi:hypothetical protein